MLNATTGQLWPLQSGSTNQPTLTPGAQTTFQFQDVPDRSPTGPLAYYLPGCLLTFSGNVVTTGTGSQINSDAFFAALFSNLAWIQAWHGTPISSQHVLGSQWQVTEYMVNGQRYASNVHGVVVPSGAGTTPFEVTIFVPFSSCRSFNLSDETSQLALLARASQLQINVAPSSVLTNLFAGTTAAFTSFKARCSAILEPRQELVLGTPIETILTQIVAGSGNSVKITNFGTDTGLQGIDPGGGVLNLLFLTARLQQGGSFDTANILDFTWQWRGQSYTQDVLGLLQQWKRQVPTPLPGNVASLGSLPPGATLQGIPYTIGNSTQFSPQTIANSELQQLLFWALVLGGPRPRLSSLQTADSDQTFNMTINGGYTGTHQILGQYARSWQPQMIKSWVAQVMAGADGSLARHVLGVNYDKAQLTRRGSAGHAYHSDDQARYLPWQLVPGAVAQAAR